MFGTKTRPEARSVPRRQAPCGFDAGDGDLYRYVGNDPTNATDPTGLDPNVKPVPVFPPKAGNYGAFIWPIKWSLDKDASSGTIMQRIDVKVNIMQKGANGGIGPAPWGLRFKGGGQIFKHWYETWQVTNGKVDDESAVLATEDKDAKKVLREDFPDQTVKATEGVLKGLPVVKPGIEPKELTAVANDWFMGLNAGRVPGKAEPRTTWGYVSVTAQAHFYPGMTVGQLQDNKFERGSKGWSGSGYLYSYAWQEGAVAEQDALKYLKDDGKLFSMFTPLEKIPQADLAIRRFVVYWNSDGATTILQGKEAEDANLDEIMKTLGPKP